LFGVFGAVRTVFEIRTQSGFLLESAHRRFYYDFSGILNSLVFTTHPAGALNMRSRQTIKRVRKWISSIRAHV